MNTLFLDTQIGKKNIIVGALLFLLFGVLMGIPLTINFLGGSVLSDEQYQLWKVVHGYGIFLAVINYFLGTIVDELRLSGRQKEVLSWSFIVAALFGPVGRMILILLSVYADWYLVASLGETVFFTIGLAMFIFGWMKKKTVMSETPAAEAGERRTARAGDY